MSKGELIIDILWSIIIGIGIIVNQVADKFSPGEFYLCLMIWLYVTTYLIDRQRGDKL